MSPAVKEVAVKLLGLPASERALLAEKLIASLDENVDDDAEVLWIRETERRYNEITEGKVGTKSAKRVLRDARAKLK
ncbi:MAG: addiction module protein [Bacteroidota bacterium]|jgi:hypothetical protein